MEIQSLAKLLKNINYRNKVYIEGMSKRATKKETELRVDHAAELVTKDRHIHQLRPLLPQNMEYQEEELGRLHPMLIFY